MFHSTSLENGMIVVSMVELIVAVDTEDIRLLNYIVLTVDGSIYSGEKQLHPFRSEYI